MENLLQVIPIELVDILFSYVTDKDSMRYLVNEYPLILRNEKYALTNFPLVTHTRLFWVFKVCSFPRISESPFYKIMFDELFSRPFNDQLNIVEKFNLYRRITDLYDHLDDNQKLNESHGRFDKETIMIEVELDDLKLLPGEIDPIEELAAYYNDDQFIDRHVMLKIVYDNGGIDLAILAYGWSARDDVMGYFLDEIITTNTDQIADVLLEFGHLICNYI
jgi:hypothetical protein